MVESRLHALLAPHSRLSLDTSLFIFIYQLEANKRYLELADAAFSWIEKAGVTAVTSSITMTELLTKPYRDGDEARVNRSAFDLPSSYLDRPRS